jgi:cytochrome c-type biogenesis protein CcmH
VSDFKREEGRASSAPTGHWWVMVGVGMAALLLMLALHSHQAAAQGDDTFQLPPGITWDNVNAVAGKMYCDVCEGIPLDECESVACRQWREEIARQLGEGRSENEIIDYFVQRYGDDVAAIPRDTKNRTLAYAIPALMIVLMGVAGAYQVQRLRQRGQAAGQSARRSTERLLTRPVPDGIDPQIIERLEQDLERLDV